MSQRLLFRGRALIDGKLRTADVTVENGCITAVSEGGANIGAAQKIELSANQTLMPAGVDGLCAMRDWAESERDTVETASMAALAAGVGFLADQANTAPRINTPELAERRVALLGERSWADFSVNAHPPIDANALARYRELGVASLQVFPWDMPPWNAPRDIDTAPFQYQHWAELGFEALFFPDELALRETPWREAGESYALRALLRRLPQDLKARILITEAASAEAILKAKDRLPNLRIAVAPHSLFLSRDEAFRRIGLGATQVPPLRSQDDVQALRAQAETGGVDMVLSHHAPHRMGDKYSEAPIEGEFTPKAGYSAVDITYPLLMTLLGLEAAARLFAENPAAQFGLKKGRIARGYDADLAIVEEDTGALDKGLHEHGGLTEGVWKIDPTQFISKGKVTPFTGERLKYRVAQTWLRGALVWDGASRTFSRAPVKQARL